MINKISKDDSDPICLAPFVGIYSAPARMSPCCEMVYDGFESIDEIWNSDLLKSLRKSFISKDITNIPKSCKDCLKSPTSHSDYYFLESRPFLKQAYLDNKQYIHEDGTMTVMPITYLTISISNKCNLACRMCYSGQSSSKHQMADRLNIVPDDELLASNIDSNYEADNVFDYLKIIEDHKDTLLEVVIHGGDPTQHKELPKLLNHMKKHLRDDCKVCFLSNGMFRKCADGEVIWDKLRVFNDLHVVFSMDAAPDLNEYTRVGIKHKRLVKLIREARAELPDAYIGIHNTVNVFTAMRYDEFLTYIETEFKHDDVWLSTNIVNSPLEYSPSNMPDNLKRDVIKRLNQYSSTSSHFNKTKFTVIKSLLSKKFDPTLWHRLIKNETIVDKDTDMDMLEILPELKPYVNQEISIQKV